MARILMLMCCWMLLASLSVCPLAAQQTPTTDPSAADSVDWESLRGTWLVESADRDGVDVPGMREMRYYFEPGLMRWASPSFKNKVTKMSFMMARYLKHREGTRYETEAIYPPAESTEVEISVDGDSMMLITRASVGEPILTMKLRRQNKRTPKPPREKMMQLAKRALAVNHLDAAYQFAQLQLMNFPDDKDAAVLLASARLDSALQMQSGFNANEMRRIQAQAYWALDKYPDEHDVRHKLAAFLSRFMLFDEAVVQYEILEAAGQFRNESLLKHVQIQRRLGNQETAKQLLLKMVGYDPEQRVFAGSARIDEPNTGFLLLADLLAAEGKDQQAIQVIDQFVQRYPQLPKSHLDRGRFYLARRETEKAEENFAKALDVDPFDREAMLVNIEVHLRDPGSEVDDLIESSFANHGREPILLVLAATRAGIKKEFDKAIALVDEGLASNPQNQSLLALKVQLLIQQQNYDAANALIDDLPKRGMLPAHAQLMRAQLLIAQKQFSAATRTLAKIDMSKASPTFADQVNVVRKELAAAMDAASSAAP